MGIMCRPLVRLPWLSGCTCSSLWCSSHYCHTHLEIGALAKDDLTRGKDGRLQQMAAYARPVFVPEPQMQMVLPICTNRAHEARDFEPFVKIPDLVASCSRVVGVGKPQLGLMGEGGGGSGGGGGGWGGRSDSVMGRRWTHPSDRSARRHDEGRCG